MTRAQTLDHDTETHEAKNNGKTRHSQMISDSQELVNYVNYKLNALGFPLLSKQENLKIVYNLLVVLEKENTYSTTVQHELSLKEKDLVKVEEEVVALKKKYKNLQDNYEKLLVKNKELQDSRDSDKLESVKIKEDIVSLKKSLNSLKTLHVHEIRGKSNQIESLKQVINKKMNSLKNEIRENYYKKFTKRDVKKEEELDFLFSSYKQREEELIRENVGVKEFFWDVLVYMKEVLLFSQLEVPVCIIAESFFLFVVFGQIAYEQSE